MHPVEEVLRHLVQFGPARNDAEREHLLGLLDPEPAPVQPRPDATAGAPEGNPQS
jgi:hypothetical protein